MTAGKLAGSFVHDTAGQLGRKANGTVHREHDTVHWGPAESHAGDPNYAIATSHSPSKFAGQSKRSH